MAGDWHSGATGELPRFARAVLEFTDGSAVYLVDSRAFATLLVRQRGDEGIPALGPDAGGAQLDGEALGRALAMRRGPLKPALLDQRVLAGLGNIYAAEALWHSELNPFVSARTLSTSELERLAAGIRQTIATARDDPGRYSRGEALARLAVYGREGEPCARCGSPIERVVQAGRSTYYCPRCQRLPSAEAAVSRAPRAARP
jgi:formamidopyrimidine-DNA glycosylase